MHIVALAAVGVAAPVPRIDVLWIELHRFGVVGDGKIVFVPREMGRGAEAEHQRARRIELNGGIEIGYRVLLITRDAVSGTTARIGIGKRLARFTTVLDDDGAGGKPHLWMRVLAIGPDVLRLRPRGKGGETRKGRDDDQSRMSHLSPERPRITASLACSCGFLVSRLQNSHDLDINHRRISESKGH